MRAQNRIAYIDGWRALAMLLVFCDHLGMNREIGAIYAKSPIGVVSEYGETGVFIFFFISGYVVSLICLKEIETSGDFCAPAFYARRLFRIVPPLMLYLFVCLSLGAGGVIDFSLDNFFSSAFYLCNSTAPFVSCNWYVGHTWSLAFEEQFYLLFPLVLSFVELRRAPKIIVAASATLVASIPFVFTIWWIGKTGFFIAYGLFFAGYAAAKHGERFIVGVRTYGNAALIVSALIVFLPRSVIASFGDDERARAELIDCYRFLYVAAIPTMVLLSGVAKTPLHDALSSGVLAYLGRASYSIYLWQQLCNGPVFNGLGVYAQLGLLSCTVFFCIALFETIERRLIERGRALSGRLRLRGRLPRGDATARLQSATGTPGRC